MSRSDLKRLEDIMGAAAQAASIIGRGEADYLADEILQRALERCLEIVGEAAKSLSQETRGRIVSVPWTDVIRLRDRLSHHYHRIDALQLWAIAIQALPDMAAAVAVILKEKQ